MNWQPIETAPRDGRYILLAGESGMTTTPLRVQVCKYDAEYRPLQPWVDHANNSFFDDGGAPTLWMPLPELPKKQESKGKSFLHGMKVNMNFGVQENEKKKETR